MTQSAPILQEYRHRIEEYIRRTESIFAIGFQADEWVQVSMHRSAVEFLTEFSQGTGFEIGANTLDTLTLDNLIMEVGEREGYLSEEKIPAGIPPSHWWWWYPNSPPDEP
jgi:hypothetical protein